MFSNRETRFFALYCLGFTFGIQYVYVNKNVTIEEAWTSCHNVYNGSLADIKSIDTSVRILHGEQGEISNNYWHGVFQKTTNWITYEGCYEETELETKRNTNLTSIAQCHAECGQEPDTYFSVGEKVCLCNDETWNYTLTMKRRNCDTDCGVLGLCKGNSTQVNIYRNVAVNVTKGDIDRNLCLGFKCYDNTSLEFIAIDCNSGNPYICGKYAKDEFHSLKMFSEFIELCENITRNEDFLNVLICHPLKHKVNQIRWTPVFRKKWYFQDTENATFDDLSTAIRITDLDRNITQPFLCKTDALEVSTIVSTSVIVSSLGDTKTSIDTSPVGISLATEPEPHHAWTTPPIYQSNINRDESEDVALIYGLSAGIVLLSALLIAFLFVYIKHQMLRSKRNKQSEAAKNNHKSYVDAAVECSMEEFFNENSFSKWDNKVEKTSLWEDQVKRRLSCPCRSRADDNIIALMNQSQSRSNTIHIENGFRMDSLPRSESVRRDSTLLPIRDNHEFEYSEIGDPILLQYKTLASVHAEDDASDKAQADVTESNNAYFTLAMVAALNKKPRDQSIEVEIGQNTSSTSLNTGNDQNLETETPDLTTDDMQTSDLTITQHQNEDRRLESVENEKNDAVYFVLEKQDS